MDKIAEQVSKWIGSSISVVVHLVWWGVWFGFGLDKELLVLFVSLEAIIITLFILRAEIVQSARLEAYIKQAVEDTKEDLKLSRDILELIKRRK